MGMPRAWEAGQREIARRAAMGGRQGHNAAASEAYQRGQRDKRFKESMGRYGTMWREGMGMGEGFANQYFGPVDAGLRKNVRDMLLEEAKAERRTGFLPNKRDFALKLRTDLKGIMTQGGQAATNFAANAAGRGVVGGGEMGTRMARDAMAPIAASANQVVAGSNLAYASAYQRGSMAEEEVHQNAVSRLMNYKVGREDARANMAAQLGTVATAGMTNLHTGSENRAVQIRGQNMQQAMQSRSLRFQYWQAMNDFRLREAQMKRGGGLGGLIGKGLGLVAGSFLGPLGGAAGTALADEIF